MKKVIYFLVLSFSLTGCFGSGEDSESLENTGTKSQSFKIGNTTWDSQIPKGWKQGALLSEDMILNYQNLDESFVIIRRQGSIPPLESILEEAKSQFFSFETISKQVNLWQFKGKIRSQAPERLFWQRIHPIPNSNYFLLGSCSYEFIENRTSACENIIKNWNTQPVNTTPQN